MPRSNYGGYLHSLQIAFRRPRNLRDLLVRATLTIMSHELFGNYPCGASKCKTCPILMVTDEFFSITTRKVFKTKFHPSCKSSDVIYLIMCRRYGLKYVGETGQPLHLRVSGRQYDITYRKTDGSSVVEHFNSGTHTESDMAVKEIDLVCSRDGC